MNKRYCEHCICLIDKDGVWVCDELSKPISAVSECPESTCICDNCCYYVVHPSGVADFCAINKSYPSVVTEYQWIQCSNGLQDHCKGYKKIVERKVK